MVENIELISPIRESVTRGIVIENPTTETVIINQSQFTIGNEYVEVTPEELKIPAKDSRKFEINFRPLMIINQSQFTIGNEYVEVTPEELKIPTYSFPMV